MDRKTFMAHLTSRQLPILLAVFLAWSISGCGRSDDAERALAEVNATKMQRLANLYLAYQMKNSWKGPSNEKAFKDFIGKFDPMKLQRIGIDPKMIDDLFVNDRDGQPFRIRYSVPGSAMGSSAPVVFEATGVDGKRLVGFLDMQQREVESAEYDTLWAAKTEAAPSQREAR